MGGCRVLWLWFAPSFLSNIYRPYLPSFYFVFVTLCNTSNLRLSYDLMQLQAP